MISGGYYPESVGKSVEVFAPSTGQHCQVADLPARRYSYSMEERTLCGGADTESETSCLTLTSSETWERTTTLLENR